MSLKHQAYKEANIRFLEENLQNEGINELPSGIQYKVILKYCCPMKLFKLK